MDQHEPVADARRRRTRPRRARCRGAAAAARKPAPVTTHPDQVAVLENAGLGAAGAGERAGHDAQPEQRHEQREARVTRAELLLGEQQLADVEQAREQDDRGRSGDDHPQPGHPGGGAHARPRLAQQRARAGRRRSPPPSGTRVSTTADTAKLMPFDEHHGLGAREQQADAGERRAEREADVRERAVERGRRGQAGGRHEAGEAGHHGGAEEPRADAGQQRERERDGEAVEEGERDEGERARDVGRRGAPAPRPAVRRGAEDRPEEHRRQEVRERARG